MYTELVTEVCWRLCDRVPVETFLTKKSHASPRRASPVASCGSTKWWRHHRTSVRDPTSHQACCRKEAFFWSFCAVQTVLIIRSCWQGSEWRVRYDVIGLVRRRIPVWRRLPARSVLHERYSGKEDARVLYSRWELINSEFPFFSKHLPFPLL